TPVSDPAALPGGGRRRAARCEIRDTGYGIRDGSGTAADAVSSRTAQRAPDLAARISYSVSRIAHLAAGGPAVRRAVPDAGSPGEGRQPDLCARAALALRGGPGGAVGTVPAGMAAATGARRGSEPVVQPAQTVGGGAGGERPAGGAQPDLPLRLRP